MAKDKRPAFQWYPKDYLADEDVVLMSLEEQGAYVRLLCYCWLEGSIPSELPKLARLCGVSPEAMERIWPGVEKCFKRDVENSGRYTNPRLENERRKQDEFKKKKKAAGKKGAKAKWDKEKDGSAINLPMANDSSAVCSLQFASSSASNDVPSSLEEYLGEYAGCLAGMDTLAQRAWMGTWGPNGTDEGVWRGIAPGRQPPILSTAILAWRAASTDGRFHRGFCRKILTDAIADAIAADHARGRHDTEAAGAHELRDAAREHEAREIQRLQDEARGVSMRGGGPQRISIGVDPTKGVA